MSDDLHEDGPLLHVVIHALREELDAAHADRARLVARVSDLETLWDEAQGDINRLLAEKNDLLESLAMSVGDELLSPTTAHDGLTTTEGE